MTHGTSQPPEPPSPTLAPQPNQILAAPDTVETCRAEYQAGSDVRARLDEQIRNGR